MAIALLCPASGQAQQQQRVVVVPADAGVVIAARGQPQPRAAMAPAPSAAALARSRARPPAGSDRIMDSLGPALLPLMLAGIVAATLAASNNSGSGTSAPARTQ